MALLEKQLVVKPSSLPNSGKGLFTKKFIAKGTRIVEYKGKKTTWKNVNIDEGRNGYIYYINRNHVIDASLNKNKNLARYANDAKGSKKIETLANNCRYVQDSKLRVYIESKKDIPANSEILVGYGKQYWDIIMENKKQLKKKKRAKKDK